MFSNKRITKITCIYLAGVMATAMPVIPDARSIGEFATNAEVLSDADSDSVPAGPAVMVLDSGETTVAVTTYEVAATQTSCITTTVSEAVSTTVTTTNTTSCEETEESTASEDETEPVVYEFNYEDVWGAEGSSEDDVVSEETECTEAIVESEVTLEYSGNASYTEYDIVCLAMTIAGEARDCSEIQQKCVVWTVLNRLDSGAWGADTIQGIIYAPSQFAPADWYRDDHYAIAKECLEAWSQGYGCVLPDRGYTKFYGDGRLNHFYRPDGVGGEYVPQ